MAISWRQSVPAVSGSDRTEGPDEPADLSGSDLMELP